MVDSGSWDDDVLQTLGRSDEDTPRWTYSGGEWARVGVSGKSWSKIVSAPPGTGLLQGKVAMVVGAGQQEGETMGNGRAAALVFAREGARLFCVDRDRASCEETARKCIQLGVHAEYHVADISQESEVEAMVKQCVDFYGGRLDVVHNNVGVAAGDSNKLLELDLETYHRIMAVNLTGMLHVCKHTMGVMRSQGAGSIINVSSIGSVLTLPGGGGGGYAYKMSKAAVNKLTQDMAMENAEHGVRVNCILPGLLDTPLSIERRAEALVAQGGANDLTSARELVREARSAQVPMRRMGSAMDVAEAALFLASDRASFITGVLLPVDGGSTVATGCVPSSN